MKKIARRPVIARTGHNRPPVWRRSPSRKSSRGKAKTARSTRCRQVTIGGRHHRGDPAPARDLLDYGIDHRLGRVARHGATCNRRGRSRSGHARRVLGRLLTLSRRTAESRLRPCSSRSSERARRDGVLRCRRPRSADCVPCKPLARARAKETGARDRSLQFAFQTLKLGLPPRRVNKLDSSSG